MNNVGMLNIRIEVVITVNYLNSYIIINIEERSRPMTFSDDGGGFTFSCDDAKMSICASSWSTRLSQIGSTENPIFIVTRELPDINYILKIIGKRPRNIYIIANTSAEINAKLIKNKFPRVRILLHHDVNAKIVMVSPNTIWISSADFGKTTKIESTIGIHSSELFDKTVGNVFNKIWLESVEIT